MKWIILLFIALTSANAQWGKAVSPPLVVPAGADSFDCGEYSVAGKFMDSKKGDTFIELYPSTSRSFPISLHGMTARDASLLNGLMIRVKLQVIKAGKGNLAKFIVMAKPAHITKSDALHDPILKVTSKPCQ